MFGGSAAAAVEADADRTGLEPLVAVAAGDLAGQAGADRAVVVADLVAELPAPPLFDGLTTVGEHALRQLAAVEHHAERRRLFAQENPLDEQRQAS